MSFRDYIKKISPPWLANTYGERLLFGIALPVDALFDMLNQGIKARMPGYGTSTALTLIGNDRSLPRYASESDFAYIFRLQNAFDTWHLAGGIVNFLSQLAVYFLPAAPRFRVVSGDRLWYTYSAGVATRTFSAMPNWLWDTTSNAWWRSWVIIDPLALGWTVGPVFGAAGVTIGGTTRTIGSSVTQSQASEIFALVRKWKPAHTYLVSVMITFDTNLFEATDAYGADQPDQTYANYSVNTGGTQVPTRKANARYSGPIT